MKQNGDVYREWPLASAEVRCAWALDVTRGGIWTQPATEFWGLGFSATSNGLGAELIGPAAIPQHFQVQVGDRFWGIEFRAHVFLRGIRKESFGSVQPLEVGRDGFMLAGSVHAIPGEGQLGEMVGDLMGRGLVSADPSVELALSGSPSGNARTLRRRVREVAGLNGQQIAGVERAREAFRLLSEGMSIAEVVERAGYSDQSHLTRALRTLAGRTPRQILSEH